MERNKRPFEDQMPLESLLLQKWPYSKTESTLHFLLTNYCSGSTREVTTKSLTLLSIFNLMSTHTPLPASQLL